MSAHRGPDVGALADLIDAARAAANAQAVCEGCGDEAAADAPCPRCGSLARASTVTEAWWRQAGPAVYCACGQQLHMHRIDTAAMGRDDGTCTGFRPAEVRWTERRVVRQPIRRWPA